MSRRKNVYLGTRVRDTRKKGLDNLREVEGIAEAIIRDYKSGRIGYRKAMSRLNLLELIVSRDSDFQKRSKKKKARSIVDKFREKLEALRKKRSQKKKRKRK